MKSKTNALFVIFIMFFCVSRGLAADGWKTYFNERFGFSIEVPPGLTAQEAPANDDGLSFVSGDGSATLLVFGGYNVLDQSPETLLEDLTQDTGAFTAVSYQRLGRDWVVVSGHLDQSIVYQKTLFSCAGEVLNTLIFTYPIADKQQYDPDIARLSRSLMAGRGYGTPDGC